MFGYFKVDNYCPRPVYAEYRKYYCFLCRALEKYYGEPIRFLLSFDVTLLLALFTEDGFLADIPEIKCIRKTDSLKKMLSEETAVKIAALHILLIAMKVDDDLDDEGRIGTKLASAALGSKIRKAKETAPEMWDIIHKKYKELQVLEKDDADIEIIESKFADILLTVARECFSVSDSSRLAILESCAKWLYFIDAVDDIDENIQDNSFNPYRKIGSFHALKNQNYLQVAKHFQSLFKDIKPLKGKENAAVINYMVFYNIPSTTYRILINRS